MNLDPQVFEGWGRGLSFGLLVLFGSELLLLALRQLSRRKRIGLLQHLWALAIGLFTFLGFLGRVHPMLDRIATAAAILLSVHVVYVLIDELLLRRPWDRAAGPFLPKLGIDVIRALALVAAALFVAKFVFGFPLNALLVSSTVLSAVLGFALQGTLSNFASGVMILLYRPFDVGDVVTAGGTTGKVEAMTLVSTTILTPDNQRIIVPNNSIWGDVITNVTGNDTRRVDMVFGIGYEDDIAKAQSILERVVAEHPLTLDDPAPKICVHELADSSVNFTVGT